MKLAIMQPYLFPYLGYYQLAYAVEKFVFYDDVNFIKKGWINRNNILVNKKKHLFTVPLQEISQHKKISEILLHPELFPIWEKKWKITLQQAYKKAPYFKNIFPLIEETLAAKTTISELAKSSIINVIDYLELNTEFILSSNIYDNKSLNGQDRILSICDKEKAKIYINPSGGKELYDKNLFKDKGIDLYFIESNLSTYKQFDNEFIAGLSIIDILMFNSKENINKLLLEHTLK